MLVDGKNLKVLEVNIKSTFQNAFKAAKPVYSRLATEVPSSTRENVYGWISGFPSMREFIGERLIKNLQAYKYSIENRKFESTITIKRDDLEDDQFSLYTSLFADMGEAAAIHPDELLFDLLRNGHKKTGFDGQYFFDSEHPVNDKGGFHSNYIKPKKDDEFFTQGNPWYLLNTDRAIKPFIWQVRSPYEIKSITSENEYSVFMREEYLYGIRARANMGYGFWQQAVRADIGLNAVSFEMAYSLMVSQKDENNRPLRIKPNILLVGESNRVNAFRAVQADKLKNGEPNPNYNLVEVIVSPFLD
ncbi:hypothetical protein ITM29_001955 [Salmonella enterica]|nr:hypothetical protein [Salmonella enterica]EBC0623055.1 hypothetical protein [Salmonella enterica]EBQ2131306.1 hypothetical protein [Salmonella enterica]EBT1279506.1 hypothetical protein [Salmonella enterica]EDW7573118.1 hypothetical protein [Salmonella enterica]